MTTLLTNRNHNPRGRELTERDLERRIIVAFGFHPGELLPPYDYRVSERAARKVLNYLRNNKQKGRMVRKYALAAELWGNIGDFKTSPVELVGCFAEHCIYDAANYFLRADYSVLINIQMIIPFNATTASKMKNHLLNRLLFRQEDRRYRELENKILFYRV